MTTSLISADFPTLTGRQEPHHLLESREGVDSFGRQAVELGRRCRRTSLPWQAASLFAMLRVVADVWAHPDCVLIVPRQNGKTLILVIRCLFGLFVLGERIVYSAHRWPTAEDAYKRMWAMIVARPSLRRRVVKTTCSQGMGYIELENGARIAFITRSNDSGRGLDEVDLIVYDEAYNLTDGQTSALSWTQMAAKNPQTIYASSAVNAEQHTNGLVLSGMRRRGLAGGAGLYFAEFMAPEEMQPWDSLDAARYANPSYGVIQTDAKVISAQRKAVTAEARRSYAVEALGRGIWPSEAEDHDPVVDMQKWADMAQTNIRTTGPIALAIEMTDDRQWITIAAAVRTTEGKIRPEIGYYAAPSRAAVDKILDLITRWDPCCVVIRTNSPAKSLLPDLKSEQIEPEIASSGQVAEACGGFYDDAVNGMLSHAADPRLTDSLRGAEQKTLAGGAFVWAGASIATLQAASLARWGLITFGAENAPPPPPASGDETESASDELDLFAAAF